MIINKNIVKYITFEESSIFDVFKKIEANKRGVVFAVTERGKLVGSISDGDIRRCLLEQTTLDLEQNISDITTKPCISCSIDADPSVIEEKFTLGIGIIPLIDNLGHVIAVADVCSDSLSFENHDISSSSPCFIIAEIGNNHQGDLEHAKKLVDKVIEAGADCAKFQMRSMKKLYRNEGEGSDPSADLGAQYTLDILSKFQLSNADLFAVFDYCKEKGITPLCTPWDRDSLEELEKYGMPAYKVASADLTNHDLLTALAKTHKPLICSTGMSTEAEILTACKLLDQLGVEFAFLHCNSTYPAPFKDINLKYLARLERVTKKIVGYSGHERGIEVPLAAVAMGASIIEKHFTLDKHQEGNDHRVSLLPDEFKLMVDCIRNIETAMGRDVQAREVSQGEVLNREVLAKSLIINRPLNKGQIIKREMIDIKSPGQGLQPNRIDELVGKEVSHDFNSGDYFFESDLGQGVIKKPKYSFRRPYGIPVRFHDYEKMINGIELDFIEFHLSYADLDFDYRSILSVNEDTDFAVHAPELFKGDHIMDLASFDNAYREHSISELQRVIVLTRDLNLLFPKTKTPVLVINAGGWDTSNFLEMDEKKKKYQLIAHALAEIDDEGVQIAIQTMPPFPWHFGGQSHHNLFVDPDEINDFCMENNAKICYDVSHSMMACNYYCWPLSSFTPKILPHVVHMHVVDAKGVDGEGVQIGKGDVNFKELGEQLDAGAEGVMFLPEVWQGHKNHGQGFWDALAFLEKAWK
jgi:sialic acid synthase SpsE/sugar phosphate isomerase/epimerase